MKRLILGVVIQAVTLSCKLRCIAADIMGQATVVDGDTLEVHGQRIRLFGIDAPEAPQTCTAGGEAYQCGQKPRSPLPI